MLASFLDSSFSVGSGEPAFRIGDYKWGVYAFYDYDGEPIYVGQSNEKIRTRIRRHLTNQRTDAVAMSVLDPFEVLEIEVWPLAEYQQASPKTTPGAVAHLNALERAVYTQAIEHSRFRAVLNEKNPPNTTLDVTIPQSLRGRIVSDEVLELRSHPDLRIARRALTMSRLAQVIAERRVRPGLRRVLLTQAKRLEFLAQQRYTGLGGEASVEQESSDPPEEE